MAVPYTQSLPYELLPPICNSIRYLRFQWVLSYDLLAPTFNIFNGERPSAHWPDDGLAPESWTSIWARLGNLPGLQELQVTLFTHSWGWNNFLPQYISILVEPIQKITTWPEIFILNLGSVIGPFCNIPNAEEKWVPVREAWEKAPCEVRWK